MRVFPKEVGWLPWGWLVYLFILFIQPAFDHAAILEWAVTIAATLVFLPLYVAGYWVRGAKALLVIAGMTLLATLMTPFNAAAGVFFIYAAACAGWKLAPSRWAAIGILGVTAVAGLDAWSASLPLIAWIWPIVFSPLIGFANLHGAERVRANAKLHLAHEEIERLAKLAERERIARDLHDLLGHTLSVIVLKSELAGKLMTRDPVRAHDEIHEVETIARDALSEVRSAVRGYRSRGLAAEIEHAAAVLDTAGVACEVALEAIDLPPRKEAVLSLAVREAVTNVVRHAAATHCRIRVEQKENGCLLTIEDDGRGGSSPFGSGLTGMKERVEAEGGSLERQGTGGTTLTVVFPSAFRTEAMEEPA